MLTLGIDPGLFGSIALLDANAKLFALIDMPTLRVTESRRQLDTAEIIMTLKNWRVLWGDMRCVIEEPMVRGGEGVLVGFKSGRSFGRLEGILATMGIPIEVVTPKTWQKAVLGKVDKGTAKDRSRAKAQELYPLADLGKRKSQDRSDALLIAWYGWQRWKGNTCES